MLWRMPGAGEPAASLAEVGVAEVAEALEAPLREQLRARVDEDILVVYSVTSERRAVAVLLFRHHDSFVWRVARGKSMNGAEFANWLGRSNDA